MKRLLDYDPLTGVSTFFHESHDGNTFGLETVQDTQPIMDYAKQLRDIPLNKKSEMWHAATIPVEEIHKWYREGIDVFSKDPWMKKKVADKINSNEFLKLRTKEFKL